VRSLVVVLVLATCTPAYADPPPPDRPIKFPESVEIIYGAGESKRLPPGYWLDESHWDTLDRELRRLQDAETRLEAENEVFRKEAGMSWRIALAVFGLGVAAGVGGALWITR